MRTVYWIKMMNNQQLWQQLQSKGLTTQSAYPETTETTIEVLWYVRLLQGIGGWFAALFLIGGVAFMVAPIFDKPIIFGLLGLVMSFSRSEEHTSELQSRE